MTCTKDYMVLPFLSFILRGDTMRRVLSNRYIGNKEGRKSLLILITIQLLICVEKKAKWHVSARERMKRTGERGQLRQGRAAGRGTGEQTAPQGPASATGSLSSLTSL